MAQSAALALARQAGLLSFAGFASVARPQDDLLKQALQRTTECHSRTYLSIEDVFLYTRMSSRMGGVFRNHLYI